MNKRPEIKKWKQPKHISEYPVGPSFEAGHIVLGGKVWRTYVPGVDREKCTGCLRCYLICPDGAVVRSEKKIEIDLDYCKGCGSCAYECPVRAIEMRLEAGENG